MEDTIERARAFAEHGVNIGIYANQLSGVAFAAMRKTAEDILRYHRAKDVDDRLMPIKDIITLIDEVAEGRLYTRVMSNMAASE